MTQVTIQTTLDQLVAEKNELIWWRTAATVLAYRLSVEINDEVELTMPYDSRDLIDGSSISDDRDAAVEAGELIEGDEVRTLKMDAE